MASETAMASDTTALRPAAGHWKSPFIPLLLLAASLLGWLCFQTYQLVIERQQLAMMRVAQTVQVEAAGKLRGSLDSVASATAQLANGGNISARLIIEELRKRGITINSTAPK
jgi:hypothetical protein